MNVPRPSGPPSVVPDADLLGFAQAWPALSRFFDAVARLPAEAADVQARYGPFTQTQAVAAFATAVSQARQVGARLGGSPALALRLAADPQALTRPEAPDDVFSQLAWLARQVADAAPPLAGAAPAADDGPDGGTGAERDASRRWGLAGPGGPSRKARAVAENAAQVRAGLAALKAGFVAALQGLHGSELVNHANVAIGRLQSSLSRLQDEQARASERAGHWWHRARSEEPLRALEGHVADERDALARQQALVHDTASLFSDGNAVIPALAGIDTRLFALEQLFGDAAERLSSVAQIASPQQLADDGWLQAALGGPAARQRWDAIGAAARQGLDALLAPAGVD